MSSPPDPQRAPRIALIGSRGIPACYGGYETLMEELAPRLLELGLDVTVYCRSHYTPSTTRRYRGVRLVVLPTVRTKHLDTPVHTFLSAVHAAFRRYDAAIVVNSANAVFVPLLRLGRIPTALHVDGMEKQRAKWGPFGRAVYRISERLSARVANRMITDAETIRQLYLARYGADSVMIPYGSDLSLPTGAQTLARLDLQPDSYYLYVSRFEPENNPHRVVEGFRLAQPPRRLVLLGDAPYANRFISTFKRDDDPSLLFPGAIYGDGYRELLAGAFAYVHATEVGGTHPALVEAMGFGKSVLVNDTPENREVVGDTGLYFSAHQPATLAEAISKLEADADLADELRAKSHARAEALYSWNRVASAYADLLRSLVE